MLCYAMLYLAMFCYALFILITLAGREKASKNEASENEQNVMFVLFSKRGSTRSEMCFKKDATIEKAITNSIEDSR